MKKVNKNFFKVCLISALTLSTSSAFADKIEKYAALSSCKTIVGTTETAGSGGISDGSGGIKATSDLVILSCNLPTTTITPGVEIYVKDASANYLDEQVGRTVCSLIAYDNFGRVKFSDSDFSQNGSFNKNMVFNVKAQQINNNGYFSLACRLSKGDVVYTYKHNPFTNPDSGEF